jgi:hypothetical protein
VTPSITIGFLPRERFALAGESLASLFEHTRLPFHLVVVDCATPEPYRREMDEVLAGRSDVEIVSTDRPLLPAASKNLVVERADSDYLCLVENDVLFTEGWLESLLAACEEFPADVAAPVILEGRGDREHFDKLLGSIVESDAEPGRLRIRRLPAPRNATFERTKVDLVEQHCLLFRTGVFEQIGRFDEELNTRDEIDLSVALWRAGLTIVLEPEAVIRYVPPNARVADDEVPFYSQRWDLARAIRSRERIRDRWNLEETPGDLGFVRYRNLILRLPEVRAELERLTRAGRVLLIDNGEWFETHVTEGLDIRPFPEVGGHFGGFPADDASAVEMLDGALEDGADTIVVGWPAFWWFDYLPELRRHLDEIGRVRIDDERLLVVEVDQVLARGSRE